MIVASRASRSAAAFADGFDATGRHVLRGPVLARYRAEGGPDGALGLPLSEEYRTTYEPMTSRGADREVGFRHGAIYLDSRTGETWVGVWTPYTPPPPT